MGQRFFSTKDRPFHLGPFPLERLKRVERAPDLSQVPASQALDFRQLDTPHSLVNAMGEYQAMMDVIRDGLVNPELAAAPTEPEERSRHMKSFGYFQDASMMGVALSAEVRAASGAGRTLGRPGAGRRARGAALCRLTGRGDARASANS